MTNTPHIARVGLSGVVVTFGDTLTERANLAAIAFRAAVDAEGWDEVSETASTLVSTFLSIDLTTTPFAEIEPRLTALLATRDWYAEALPPGRKLWTIPMCFEPEVAPQLAEAAAAAGLTEPAARAELTNARTRVITLGYAPGQPYLGLLPDTWDISRQAELTPQVPAGALVLAIRQFVLFTAAMPTGWRHVGQTAFRPFDPQRAAPVALAPGDEIRFAPITARELGAATDTLGGAVWEPLP
ncbi:MAG: carboxyltransferase domain-containing protein [Pseudomonadota bacterium]